MPAHLSSHASPGGGNRAAMEPYHEGERAVQQRAGVRDAANELGRTVRPALGRGSQLFLASVSLLVIGAADDDGRCWASMMCGEPGFVQPSATSVRIGGVPADGDPLAIRHSGDAIGLLALDLRTVRRYRVNGQAVRWGPRIIEIAVEQAYGNCPRFIRRQDQGRSARPSSPAHVSSLLTPAHQRLIEGSDRMFVATRHPTAGADVSHKGGPPGFVSVISPGRLRFPDYPGNNMFNTLGNLSVDPGIGLLFHDFVRQATLQITGQAWVDFAAGDQRAVDVTVTKCVYRAHDHSCR